MIEWLEIWGVTSAVGFLFKPILEDLAKDAAKKWATDLFKNSLKNVLTPSKKVAEQIEIAAGKAIKVFLDLLQGELEAAEVEDMVIEELNEPMKRFIKDDTVKDILGEPFHEMVVSINISQLTERWDKLEMPALPGKFDWGKIGKIYVKKTKAILQESEELRKITDSNNSARTANALIVIAGPGADFSLSKYRDGILDRYQFLKLDNIDKTGYAYNTLKLWNMFVPQNVRECHKFIPQHYELPMDVQRELKCGQTNEALTGENLELYRKMFKEQSAIAVTDLIKDTEKQHLVILGYPGSGKSTLLQYIALGWAEKPTEELSRDLLPLLIELRAFARDCENGVCMDFLGYCKSGNIFCHIDSIELHEMLKRGNVVAMFDGLDEVFDPGQRENVITAIIRFANDYPQVRTIVTSRVIGYKHQAFRDAQFHHFIIQDLEYDQIEDFIQHWHDLTYADESDRSLKQNRLREAIKDTHAIRELAGNPLLLTLMAILNRNQELPRDRTELYREASKLLLHQWDIERTLTDKMIDAKSFDYRDKQTMLRDVAYFMQSSEKGLAGNMIRSVDLERILAKHLKRRQIKEAKTVARHLIDRLRERNFILCFLGADYYAFVHRTFLEFFCAWEIEDRFRLRGSENGLNLEDLKSDIYGKHWNDETWQEVLRLIAGMIPASFAGDIIAYLILIDGEVEKFRNLFLAYDCLKEVRERSTLAEVTEKIKIRMWQVIKSPMESKIRADAGEIIGRLGDERDLKAFIPIPKGTYPLSLGLFETDRFEIGQYPVTNQWFKEFVEDDGYKRSEYWSEQGNIWRESRKTETPLYWLDGNWNCPNSPVVGVSWYEAHAFTEWLNQTRKDGYRYFLPDENQWEAAAAGMGKREYPWGNEWKEDSCNSSESKIQKTTPVGIYAKGNTPEGISDLAGNVGEWAQSDYHSKKSLSDFRFDKEMFQLWEEVMQSKGEDQEDKKKQYVNKLGKKDSKFPVIRGGAWIFDRNDVRCAGRDRDNPDDRFNNLGFRCARTKN